MRNLKKYFPIKKNLREIFRFADREYTKAVDNVSFGVEKGKVFVLAGESGSGKTTLARLILRAIEPDSGSIIFDEQDITRKTESELRGISHKDANDLPRSLYIIEPTYENNGYSHGAIEYSRQE